MSRRTDKFICKRCGKEFEESQFNSSLMWRFIFCKECEQWASTEVLATKDLNLNSEVYTYMQPRNSTEFVIHRCEIVYTKTHNHFTLKKEDYKENLDYIDLMKENTSFYIRSLDQKNKRIYRNIDKLFKSYDECLAEVKKIQQKEVINSIKSTILVDINNKLDKSLTENITTEYIENLIKNEESVKDNIVASKITKAYDNAAKYADVFNKVDSIHRIARMIYKYKKDISSATKMEYDSGNDEILFSCYELAISLLPEKLRQLIRTDYYSVFVNWFYKENTIFKTFLSIHYIEEVDYEEDNK